MRALKLLLLSFLFLSFTGDSARRFCLCKILPANNIDVPVEANTGITEVEFNAVIDEFLKVNKPLAKAKGYDLVIKNQWTDGTVNASTIVQGNKWVINAYGGLARYENMNADTYMLVLCHELGHHLGGFPAQGWASNEGESDYYAASKCFPRMSYSRAKSFFTPDVVSKKCSLMHKSQTEINICEKTSMTALNLANILNNMSRDLFPLDCVEMHQFSTYCNSLLMGDISFNTPDKRQVTVTDDRHPNAQCRLDTYFAGAVCGVPYTEDLSQDNPIQGACAEEKGDKVGVRPRCWYKPNL